MRRNLQSKTVQAENDLRKKYLLVAIQEYEYSFAPEYQKRRMTQRATKERTVGIESHNAVSDVEISPDGAWVKARVWVPNTWLISK
jgi:hypothetical protein